MSGSGGVPVFLSWSGARSKAAAEALKVALPRCIQTVRPWMSDTAIRAGTRWFEEIGSALEGTRYCIAVLTADNLESQWVHFEAGAISKTIGDSHVVPYLVGIEPQHVQGPLRHFNGVLATREGTLKLITDLHAIMGPDAPALDVVEDAFDSAWPKLEAALADLPDATSGPPPAPDEPALLGQIADRLSGVERSLANLAASTALNLPVFLRGMQPNPSRGQGSLSSWPTLDYLLRDDELDMAAQLAELAEVRRTGSPETVRRIDALISELTLNNLRSFSGVDSGPTAGGSRPGDRGSVTETSPTVDGAEND